MRINLLKPTPQQQWNETMAAFYEAECLVSPFNMHNTKSFRFGWTKPAVCIDTLQFITEFYIFSNRIILSIKLFQRYFSHHG